ncbi:hypothetical protein Q8A67_014638 [Cirrhinus molitorella]|uniref:Uncharacterized protein n=1 Tax=Cirrhinus molitorella TaxID=172907 RepID=A0AA88PK09_9TELE|nr:hypothetical protein Q8A67_014638 [Cirrhinus molitorella]
MLVTGFPVLQQTEQVTPRRFPGVPLERSGELSAFLLSDGLAVFFWLCVFVADVLRDVVLPASASQR